jgi:hypothetical protein
MWNPEDNIIHSKYGLLIKPTLFDFLHEKLITLVPFSIALIALFRYSKNNLWPLLYLGIIGAHMLHILLQRCPHCAYYKAETKWHECLWWRWVPKIRKEKSSPPPRYISTYTPIAVLTITFYPIYWMTFQWELLILYILSWGVLAISIYTAGCARCIDFGCKNNAVPKKIQDAYLSAGKSQLTK